MCRQNDNYASLTTGSGTELFEEDELDLSADDLRKAIFTT